MHDVCQTVRFVLTISSLQEGPTNRSNCPEIGRPKNWFLYLVVVQSIHDCCSPLIVYSRRVTSRKKSLSTSFAYGQLWYSFPWRVPSSLKLFLGLAKTSLPRVDAPGVSALVFSTSRICHCENGRAWKTLTSSTSVDLLQPPRKGDYRENTTQSCL